MIYRLFFGGLMMVGIESIRLISNNKNFERITQSLCCLDSLVSNSFINEKVWKKIGIEDVNILRYLIGDNITDNNHNNNNNDNGIIYDNYIYSTWECFLRNKQQIVISMPNMEESYVNAEMRDLIMHSLEFEGYPYKDKPRDLGDYTNLFKKQLFQIFCYTKNIKFITDRYSRISLWTLSEIVSGSGVHEIYLQIYGSYDFVRRQYPISPLLVEKYAEINYNISDLKREGDYVICIISLKTE